MATRNGKGSWLVVLRGPDRVLCARCRVADRPLARMQGLLGRRSLGSGEGLLLRPANAIHTAFMRFAIDAVFLDSDGLVLRVASNLRPWRMAVSRGAKAVLELPAGAAAARDVQPGTKLELSLPPRNQVLQKVR